MRHGTRLVNKPLHFDRHPSLNNKRIHRKCKNCEDNNREESQNWRNLMQILSIDLWCCLCLDPHSLTWCVRRFTELGRVCSALDRAGISRYLHANVPSTIQYREQIWDQSNCHLFFLKKTLFFIRGLLTAGTKKVHCFSMCVLERRVGGGWSSTTQTCSHTLAAHLISPSLITPDG